MPRPANRIDVELVQSLYDYDSKTGDLTSKKTGRVLKAKGGPNGIYRSVNIEGKLYYQHRVAWAIYHSEDPGDLVVDHIDHNGHNNAIDNLRACTHEQNICNRSTTKGYTKRGNRFEAQIKHKTQTIYIGLFETAEAARAAYLEKATELFGEFAIA